MKQSTAIKGKTKVLTKTLTGQHLIRKTNPSTNQKKTLLRSEDSSDISPTPAEKSKKNDGLPE